jgi:hypothetical protein
MADEELLRKIEAACRAVPGDARWRVFLARVRERLPGCSLSFNVTGNVSSQVKSIVTKAPRVFESCADVERRTEDYGAALWKVVEEEKEKLDRFSGRDIRTLWREQRMPSVLRKRGAPSGSHDLSFPPAPVAGLDRHQPLPQASASSTGLSAALPGSPSRPKRTLLAAPASTKRKRPAPTKTGLGRCKLIIGGDELPGDGRPRETREVRVPWPDTPSRGGEARADETKSKPMDVADGIDADGWWTLPGAGRKTTSIRTGGVGDRVRTSTADCTVVAFLYHRGRPQVGSRSRGLTRLRLTLTPPPNNCHPPSPERAAVAGPA